MDAIFALLTNSTVITALKISGLAFAILKAYNHYKYIYDYHKKNKNDKIKNNQDDN